MGTGGSWRNGVRGARLAGLAALATTGALGGPLGVTADAASGPTVTAISPSQGPAAGGTVVSVTGSGFAAGSTQVTVGSTTLSSAEVDVVSSTRIDLLTPPGVAGTSQAITVTVGGVSSSASAADQFSYFSGTLPDCRAALTPEQNLCQESAGGSLTITAGSLSATASFGDTALGSIDLASGSLDVPASSVVFPSSQVTVATLATDVSVAPAGSLSGSFNLVTGNTSIQAAASIGVYVQALSSFCVFQQTLSASGSITKLAATSTPGVVAASGSLAASGPLTVSNNDGASGCATVSAVLGSATYQATLPFTAYLDVPPGTPTLSPTSATAPTVTSLSPADGPTAGGTTVAIVGSGFATVSSSGALTPLVTSVQFGSTAVPAAAVDVVSPSLLLVPSPPASAATTVPLTVTSSLGTSPTTNASSFTYGTPTPCSATSLDASTNLCVASTTGASLGITTAGGTPLSFSGFALSSLGSVDPSSGTLTVPATNVTVPQVDAQLLGISAPVTLDANGPFTGSFDLSHGQATVNGTLAIGIFVPPTDQLCVFDQPLSASGTLGSFSATSTPDILQATGTLTASGPVDAAENDDGSGCGIVADLLAGATEHAQIPFVADEYNPPAPQRPVVSGVSPSSGSTAGGTVVTVSGTGLSGATVVDFGSVPASSLTVNAGGTQLTATSPAESAGTVDVTVTTPGGTSATSSADQFTYVAPSSGGTAPVVSSVSPKLGPTTGGTSVTIGGSGFTGVTGVDFGSQPALSFQVVDADQIVAVAPPGQREVDITVTTASGTSSMTAADRYGYVVPPAVSLLFPGSAPADSGYNLVFIIGRGFEGATAVEFGSQPAPFLTLSPAVILAFAPPEPAATVDVTVTTWAGGTSPTVSSDQYRYVPWTWPLVRRSER